MRYNRLGTSDLMVSAIGLGSMTWGGQNTEAEAHAQLDFAFERGVNFVDTAEMYPVPTREATQGLTESFVGSWLARQPRERVILATKVTGPARHLGWIRGGPRLTPEQIRAALEGSLRRLRTDYVDLYQVHWPERYVPSFGEWQVDPAKDRADAAPVIEQLETLGRLVEEGKARYVGVSNETAWGVSELLRLSEQQELPRVVSIQNAYSLVNRLFELTLTEFTLRENVPLVAYSPLAMGLLTGKHRDGYAPGSRMALFEGFGTRYRRPAVARAAAAYCDLARAHGVAPAAMALAWCASRWFCASALVGATTLEQLAQNVGAADLSLPPELVEGIERIHAECLEPAI